MNESLKRLLASPVVKDHQRKSCLRKKGRYLSKANAETIISFRQSRNIKFGMAEGYLCSHCGDWHISRKKQK